MEWLAPLISGLSVIIVAIIEGLAAHERKCAKAEKEETEIRAKLRAEESQLSMRMMSATCALSLVCAKKLNGHETNGDVAEALNKANEAQQQYDEFLKRIGLQHVGE